MTVTDKVIMCWSGGKDSALCLHKVLNSGRTTVVGLLTTINKHYQRVSMHGIREKLLDEQVASIGIPVKKVYVSEQSSNSEYEKNMEAILLEFKALGVEEVIFGDIFLEDLKFWREKNLARIGMKGVFPLWKLDTHRLVNEFLSLGFGSITCCVDAGRLGKEMVGRVIDRNFLQSLPADVDPCGENGEYHSFVFKGPIFRRPIEFEIGETVFKPIKPEISEQASRSSFEPHHENRSSGFWFCDLLEKRSGLIKSVSHP